METGNWPATEAELVAAQLHLAQASGSVPLWEPAGSDGPPTAGGCFLAFARGEAGPGAPGDRAWAAAVTWPLPDLAPGTARGRSPDAALRGSGPALPRHALDIAEQSVVTGLVPAAYRPGLLALREGPLLEAAVRSLVQPPGLLLVDATGQDHPRRAGLATHLGAVLGLPSIGVTHRPLLARGQLPTRERGATAPLWLDEVVVAYWVCTRGSARPVVAHAGWRTSPETAAAVVLACSSEAARTPRPLAEARRVAREARAVAEGRVGTR
jgi:deoxyribonuclease V